MGARTTGRDGTEALALDAELDTLLAVMLLVRVKTSMDQLWRRSPHCGTGGGR